MCGIAGIYGKDSSPLLPSRLIQVIAHRGPDQPARYGEIIPYRAAACRLSIVDLLHGDQPMLNREQTVCVSMNGEIYNHVRLRKELQEKGHHFLSACDTEIVLHAYEEYGIDCVKQFQGMFAIALYDAQIDTLYLMRDSSGIKPLYYLLTKDGWLAYSSEMKSFFAADLSQGKVNDSYLLSRFIFGFGPANQTFFTDIMPVLPGTYLTWHRHHLETHSYQPFLQQPYPQQEEVADPPMQIKQRFEQVVREQIPLEVPYGIFLSGGVDSSILAYVALRAGREPPFLFTVSDQSETPDRQAAREVAAFLKTEVIDLSVSVEEILSVFPRFILALEEFEPLNMFWYILALKASRFIKVALCGQGADEVFGGYPVYRNPDLLRTAFSQRYALVQSSCSSALRKQTETIIAQLGEPEGRETLYHFFLSDQLVSYQLGPVDKCTMAHGVEARVPYLAEPFIAFIRNLPPDMRFGGVMEKWLLRSAFASSHLPSLLRRKQFSGGTTLPLFAQRIQALAEMLISDQRFANHPYHLLFRSKAEMASFDTLHYALTVAKGVLPSTFSIAQFYT